MFYVDHSISAKEEYSDSDSLSLSQKAAVKVLSYL